MSAENIRLLEDGIAQLGLALSREQQEQLLSYASLLLKWNKVYKLTAITSPRDIIIQHLLDGLSILPHFAAAKNILDVGSGMGVPGVILAIGYPQARVVVLDSNSKKTAFLRQLKIELKLSNLQIETCRVENYQPLELFQIITSRAFANLALFSQLAGHLLAADGYFLAMKSEQGVQEALNLSSMQSRAIKLAVPFLAAQRFLIKMSRK